MTLLQFCNRFVMRIGYDCHFHLFLEMFKLKTNILDLGPTLLLKINHRATHFGCLPV